MATETTNYSLTKPDETDYYDVADFNDNMDIIDVAMAATATQVGTVGDTLDQIATYIGTPENEGDTLFSQSNTSEVYHASKNYKYAQDYGDGLSYTSNQILWQFTARRSGSVFVEVDIRTTTSSDYLYLYDTHTGDMVNAATQSTPLFSHSSAGGNSIATARFTSAGLYYLSHMINVSPGHTYALVSYSSGTIYASRIGYDLTDPLDLEETDIDPVE